jgi:hypothetical protein
MEAGVKAKIKQAIRVNWIQTLTSLQVSFFEEKLPATIFST